MAWFRVDNRLVHGQVIEGWLPYLDATRLVVINDSLATDELKQQIMMLAIPERITVNYVSIADAMPFFVDLENKTEKYLFLFDSCRGVIRLIEQGVTIKVLNVGKLHYAKGKRQICPHVAA